ncbi:MAG: hypothetical protein MK193_12305 [Lentisphaeria bacterium]|nr:hypothetical protein [Lentisphaeria bacterium]
MIHFFFDWGRTKTATMAALNYSGSETASEKLEEVLGFVAVEKLEPLRPSSLISTKEMIKSL